MTLNEIIAAIDKMRADADAESPWFVANITKDGLSQIEDGQEFGMFPVTGETRHITLIVALHDAWPKLRKALSRRP